MLALTLTVLQATTASTVGVTLQDASSSLSGKTQCVSFNWAPDDESTPRAAITVPIKINGELIHLQLDTGSDATILYGRAADRAGWISEGRNSFRATSLMIGSTSIDRPEIHADQDIEEDARLVGTLGLTELMGRVTVIDYPHQRFCLFSEADLPSALKKAPYVRANLRNSKLFVPVAVDAFQSDAVVFDTGSSLMPLSVDLATWRKITGLTDVAQAHTVIKGTAWGKPVTMAGAPAAGTMMVGKLNLGKPTVFTDSDQPTQYANWSFRADGVMGNASFWDGIVIVDLTAKVRFGFVK
ncbi:hypothetical protein [Novosphingobium sp. YAF33]|uniref:hypothetical protein n=1 Tax=Novosphingobium sp. YAF33 TaxID=3233082 RepID=UPI003F98E8C5